MPLITPEQRFHQELDEIRAMAMKLISRIDEVKIRNYQYLPDKPKGKIDFNKEFPKDF